MELEVTKNNLLCFPEYYEKPVFNFHIGKSLWLFFSLGQHFSQNFTYSRPACVDANKVT